MLPAALTVGLLAAAAPGAAQLPDAQVGPDSAAVTADSVTDGRSLPPEAVRHIDHIMVAFAETPNGEGLVGTGLAEARIAIQYARLAGSDSTNLAAMTRNMVHVIHALDPTQVAGGNGLGYGLKRAAEGVRTHIEFAEAVPGVSENFRFHAAYVRSAAEATGRGVDQAVALARRIQRSDDPVVAHRSIRELLASIRRLAYGADLDRDGRIGFTESEMGIAQARYHLTLVRRVAGLGG